MGKRWAFVVGLLVVACFAVGGVGFSQQSASEAGAGAPGVGEVGALREEVREESDRVSRLEGRLDGIEEATVQAARANESSARAMDSAIKAVESCAKIVTAFITLILVILGFLGWREIGNVRRIRDEMARAKEEAEKSATEARKECDTAKAAAAELAELKERMDNLVSDTEAKAKAMSGVDLSKEVSPAVQRDLEDLVRRVDMVEALGLPPDAEAYLARGNAYFTRKEYERALRCYDRAIELKPGGAVAHSNRGLALAQLGRHEEELAAYDRAIEVEPDYAAAHYNRGVALGQLGRDQEALAAYDRAIALNPDHAWAYGNRACEKARLGDREGALADLKKAIGLDPEQRQMAKSDEDLQRLRDDPEFRKLVGLEERGGGGG